MIRLLFLTALLLPGLAAAQVSVDPKALDRLQPSPPSAARRPPQHPPAHHAAQPAKPPTAKRPPPPEHPAPSPRTTKLKPGVPPTVAPAPPPAAVLPPPSVAPPAHPLSPPPVAPVVANATGAVSAIKDGVRITFGPGVSDLNPATDAAIRSFGAKMKADPASDVNLYAFAAGVADDPSTPRRLSLSRALAVRAVLISEGIVSTRIYPRALGTAPNPLGGDGPPDRVDMVLATTTPATP